MYQLRRRFLSHHPEPQHSTLLVLSTRDSEQSWKLLASAYDNTFISQKAWFLYGNAIEKPGVARAGAGNPGEARCEVPADAGSDPSPVTRSSGGGMG